MKVLVVEDDVTLNSLLKQGLSKEGFSVDGAKDGKEGLRLARQNTYDLILLDVMMPEMDGYTLLRTLRTEGHSAGILMLTSQSQEEDKLMGLDGGADDYIVKPFLLTEIAARMRAVARRVQTRTSVRAPITEFKGAGIRLDLVKRDVERHHKAIELTKKEFELLEHFLRHANRTLSQMALLQQVWNMDFDPASNVVEVHVKRLRDKLHQSGKTDPIETVRGAGYRFNA